MVLNPISEGERLREQIFGLTEGIGADIVFECSGAASGLQSAITYVNSGGQIILIGLHEKDLPFNFWTMLHQEVEMKGSLGFADEFQYVLDFFEDKKIDAQIFISDIINLADLEEKGFKKLLSSQDMVKVLVRP